MSRSMGNAVADVQRGADASGQFDDSRLPAALPGQAVIGRRHYIGAGP